MKSVLGFTGFTGFAIAGFLSASVAMAQAPTASSQPTPGNPVSFGKDVVPILADHCQVCHRSGTFAPMSLMTYEEVRPWARSIKQKVAAREMPPWYIDKTLGVQHFSNDVSLSDLEIATLVKWVDSGAPQGNVADIPAPRKFPDGDVWYIGKPDMIVNLPKDVVVKAKGPDQWPDILVDPHLAEDRYIQAVQIIPLKGHQVIHHIRTSLVDTSDDSVHSGQLDGNVALEVGEQGLFLNEYAIGKGGDIFPEGSGRLIREGTKINFQMHLH